MARREKMGAMSTGMTVALIGGGLVVLYLVMSKSTGTATVPITTVPAGTYIPGYGNTTAAMTTAQAAALQSQAAAASANTTNTEINDASSTVNNLINSIFS